MHGPLLTTEIRTEQDVVQARQRAKQLATLLGFDVAQLTRIATAISELARNAFQYAGGGRVQFSVEERPARFVIVVSDKGPGIADAERILSGRYVSPTGMGLGLQGARRLMDAFELQTAPGKGTTIRVEKQLPADHPDLTPETFARIGRELAKGAPPPPPLEELSAQNHELLVALAEVQTQKTELERTHAELAEARRTVEALREELRARERLLRSTAESPPGAGASSRSAEESSTESSPRTGASSRTADESSTESSPRTGASSPSAEALSAESSPRAGASSRPTEASSAESSPRTRASSRSAEETRAGSSLRARPSGWSDDRTPARSSAQAPEISLPAADTPRGSLRRDSPPIVRDAAGRGKVLVVTREDRAFALAEDALGELRLSAVRAFGPAAARDVLRTTETAAVIFDGSLKDSAVRTLIGELLPRRDAGSLVVLLVAEERERAAVESLAGPGAFIERPLRRETLRAKLAGVEGSVAHRKVLIIDDDPIARYTLRRVLEHEVGFSIVEAESGQDGIARARTEAPEVIFLDLRMPELDGFAVLDALKGDAATQRIPVIIHTSGPMAPREEERLRLDAVAILTKDETVSGVRRALESAGVPLAAP